MKKKCYTHYVFSYFFLNKTVKILKMYKYLYNLSYIEFSFILFENHRPPFGARFFLSFFAAHLPTGGLFESQVLPPGWLLWNQLSGVDGRVREQHVWEDMLGRFCRPLWGSRPAAVGVERLLKVRMVLFRGKGEGGA